MVTRYSEPTQLGNPGVVTQAGGGGNFARTRQSKFQENQVVDPVADTSSMTDRLLERLVGTGSKLADQAVSRGNEEAYLRGVAQAGQVESEADLQSDPLTRDWTGAGYRDTMGRIAAADADAKLSTDMKWLREQSPEEFSKYLAQRRGTLVEAFNGMTLEQRRAQLGSMLLNERAATKLHSAEHYKFVVDTEVKSVQAVNYLSNAQLNAAKLESPGVDSLGAYKAATQAAYATLNSSVLQNPKLPTSVKANLVAERATLALADDNQALFLAMQSQPVTMPDGTQMPPLSLLPADEQAKLSNAYRESLKRTEATRATGYMGDLAKAQADWDNPNTPLQTERSVLDMLDKGVRNGFTSADQYKTILQDYYKASEKKAATGTLAQAYAAGDQQAILSAGKTNNEALDAYVNAMGRKMPLQELVGNLLVLGNTTGQQNAFKKVGELMQPAFAQFGNRETINPANAASITAVLQALDASEAAGKTGATAQFMSAFDEQTAAKISYFRENLRARQDPVSAITMATERVLEDSKMTPAMRAALAANSAKDISAAVAEITPRGLWGSAVLGVQSLLSPSARAEQALTVRRKWFENEDRVNEVMATGKLELSKKMQQLATTSPHLTADSLQKQALANIYGRTVETDWGPLVVPDGTTPQQYFGVDRSTPPDRIASAMAEYLKPAEGNRVAFSLGVSGQLVVQELNEKGKPAKPSMVIDPKQVAPLVQKQQSAMNANYKENYGAGLTRKVGDAAVTYNGGNTANVDNSMMRGFRDNLVKHESVRSTPYKDTLGNTTVGVGIMERNPAYPKPGPDGKVTDAQISTSFMAASDQAARVGTKVMTSTVTTGSGAFNLFSSLAYQSGPNFFELPQYKTMLTAIRGRHQQAALNALQATPAYKASGADRRSFYEQQLKLTFQRGE